MDDVRISTHTIMLMLDDDSSSLAGHIWYKIRCDAEQFLDAYIEENP